MSKTAARIAAIAFVAVAITATATEMIRKDRKEEPPTAALGPALDPDSDPLRAALARCRDMGEAATRDPGCLRTWADNRTRFLGTPSASKGR